ncbi:flagellar hook-length control protein FliK [Alkalimonas mucilaginosa]|uniref:Flagellar hook-length control protein FliK n=1 Tax=Alkalimonas mucilaginosa TaxID=3057676 RepID=A0ABU7JHC7_9GAMM|nr:flagellar hook-length control protein FliK [Alkalimonas sp. MEB004]MEE2025096.1 flagellar hook-length control protein FliK [Alkalimonas sp. MEB004]
MNPIKLEPLLQVAANGRSSSAVITLQPEKSYHGVLLTDPVQGARLLQLSTSQGILQLHLPKSMSANNGTPMQASFQQLPDGRIQIHIQTKGEALQSFPLNQQQALTLALNWSHTGHSSPPTGAVSSATQLVVELLSNPQQSQIKLPQGPVLTLPDALHRTIQSLLAQHPQARVQTSISLGTGQEPSLFLDIQPKVQPKSALAPAAMPLSTGSTNEPAIAKASPRPLYQQLTLPTQLQQQLLHSLAQSIQQHALPARMQQQYLQLGGLMMPLPQVRLPSGSYQIALQQESQHWQLQFQSHHKYDQKLILAPEAFNRPVQWQQGILQKSPASAPQPTARLLLDAAWRSLLPVLADSPARLASLPELPPELQQALQQIRQQLPGPQQVLPAAQIQQHLQAILQFHPLQQPTQHSSSAAGTLAIAIQLLLGKLSQRPASTALQSAGQRLTPLLQQLDSQSAGQLLRQLASHSNAIQQSQLASAELQQQTPNQFLLQLPIQLEQQSTQLQLKIEQREESSSATGNKARIWQLTMHFDLLELGKLMATARLQENRLSLQIYTEQSQAQTLAKQFMPLLTERLVAQGITVEQAECQLGIVPDTLFSKHSSLITVQA